MARGVPKAERIGEAAAMLDLVKLGGYGKRKPSQLSGGQRQRAVLARALINQPRVLLLDEPLGALDLKLREQMQDELKSIQQTLGITFIFVTHDQGEALSMADSRDERGPGDPSRNPPGGPRAPAHTLRSAFNILDIHDYPRARDLLRRGRLQQRFRSLSGSLIEASFGLGATGFQTFRYVILPNLGTALLAGGMIEELVQSRQSSVTNVVAMVVVLVTFLPILGAYYLTRGTTETRAT